MSLTNQDKVKYLTKLGYNPDQFDVNESADGQVSFVPRINNQPTVSAPTTANAVAPAQANTDTNGFGDTAARAGIRALPSIAGGVAAAELTGAALDATGVGALVGVPLQIAAPFVGAYLGNKVGDVAKEKVLGPEATTAIQQQAQQDYAQHPWAVRAGNVGAMMAGGGMSPSTANLGAAIKTLRPSSPLWTGQAAAPELQNLLNVSVGAAAPTIQGLVNGQPLSDVGIDALTGALMSRPNAIGTKLWGMHPQTAPIENAPSTAQNVATIKANLARQEPVTEPTTASSLPADPKLVPGYGLPQQSPIPAPNLPRPIDIAMAQRETTAQLANVGITDLPIGRTINGTPESITKARIEANPFQSPESLAKEFNGQPNDVSTLENEGGPIRDALDAHQQEQARSVQLETAKLKMANDATEQQLAKPAASLQDVLPQSSPEAPSQAKLESPDELKQQLKDEQVKYQPKDSNEPIVDQSKPNWYGLNRAFDLLGVQHNIKLEPETGRLVNEHGVEVNGMAYLRNGMQEALAKVTPNRPDTYPHEFGHIIFDDMAKLGNPAQKRLTTRILNKVSATPEFAEYNTRRVANGKAPHDAEEFLMQHSGNEFIRRMNDPSMEGALKDFWANAKTRWGNADMEQLSRFMNNKLISDRPFEEVYGASGGNIATNDNKAKEQEASNEDNTVSDDALKNKYDIKYHEKEPTEIDPKGKLFAPTMSGVDAIRKIGSPEAKIAADAATRTLADKEELNGRFWNPVATKTEKLSTEQASNVDSAMQQSRLTGEPLVGMLRTQAEKNAFNAAREQLTAKQEEQIARNQPVMESSGAMRLPKRDSNYYPNRVDPSAYDTIKANTDRESIDKMKADFIEANGKFSGMTKEDATKAFEELSAGIRQDASKRNSGSANDGYFGANRKAESTILPESMRDKDLVRNLSGYFKKSAADLSYGKHIESNPEANKVLGGTKDLWGKELPASVSHLQSMAGNEPVKNVFDQIRGEATSMSGDMSHALESASTAAVLGPLTEVHKALSSVAQTLSLTRPTEAVQTIVHGLTNLSQGWRHALQTGSARSSGRNMSDNARMFIDANSTASDRIKALGNMARQVYTLDGMTDKFTKSFLQSSGEYLMSAKLARANAGNKTDQMLLKQLDPDYTVGKPISAEYAKQLGAQFSGMIHGTKDARTLPSWMLKDNEINSFFKLASWNIAQTNNFMRNVWTPAFKGDFNPLIMSTLGAALGGAAIKELRERLADRKGGVPSMQELLAEDQLKHETGRGKSLGDNAPLVAYNFMAYSSMAGFGGILSSVAKDVFDLRYKNQPHGSVFPLDELATATAKIGSQYASALMSPDRDASVQDITARALTDYAKATVQLARLGATAYGNANPDSLEGKKHAYGEALQDQRRFKMVEGTPYEDQSSAGAGSDVNPYLTQGATEFKKESDVAKSLEELKPLLNNIVKKYGDNWEVMQSKLEGLKSIGYETMPSLDNTPVEFSRYFSFIRKNKGEAEATRILTDYLHMKAINQLKSSMVP